jgi:hypothetical protein
MINFALFGVFRIKNGNRAYKTAVAFLAAALGMEICFVKPYRRPFTVQQANHSGFAG